MYNAANQSKIELDEKASTMKPVSSWTCAQNEGLANTAQPMTYSVNIATVLIKVLQCSREMMKFRINCHRCSKSRCSTEKIMQAPLASEFGKKRRKAEIVTNKVDGADEGCANRWLNMCGQEFPLRL